MPELTHLPRKIAVPQQACPIFRAIAIIELGGLTEWQRYICSLAQR